MKVQEGRFMHEWRTGEVTQQVNVDPQQAWKPKFYFQDQWSRDISARLLWDEEKKEEQPPGRHLGHAESRFN